LKASTVKKTALRSMHSKSPERVAFSSVLPEAEIRLRAVIGIGQLSRSRETIEIHRK